MRELNTLGDVIKEAYEGQPNTNAYTDADKSLVDHVGSLDFATVATSGSYVDLIDKPALLTMADFSSVARTGSFNDLMDKPQVPSLDTLATVASSGLFSDLVDVPDYIQTNRMGQAMGVTPLDASNKVPMEYLNVSGLAFKGSWNADTNIPALVNGTGNVGDFYKVGTAGTQNFGSGSFTFNVGDWVMFAAGVWQRLGVTESVASVNGQLGEVNITPASIGAISSVNGKTGNTSITLTAADIGALPVNYVAPVLSVNGKTGSLTLSAADVSALPATYVPAWVGVSGKPDFDALYQKKQRGTIGPAIPACLLRLNSNKNTTSGATYTIIWDAAIYDQFGIWNPATGVLTVPAWAKYMRVTGRVQFWGNETGFRQAMVFVNGVVPPGASPDKGSPNASTPYVKEFATGIIPVAGGDSVTARTTQSSGGTLAVEGTSSGNLTWLQVELFE